MMLHATQLWKFDRHTELDIWQGDEPAADDSTLETDQFFRATGLRSHLTLADDANQNFEQRCYFGRTERELLCVHAGRGSIRRVVVAAGERVSTSSGWRGPTVADERITLRCRPIGRGRAQRYIATLVAAFDRSRSTLYLITTANTGGTSTLLSVVFPDVGDRRGRPRVRVVTNLPSKEHTWNSLTVEQWSGHVIGAYGSSLYRFDPLQMKEDSPTQLLKPWLVAPSLTVAGSVISDLAGNTWVVYTRLSPLRHVLLRVDAASTTVSPAYTVHAVDCPGSPVLPSLLLHRATGRILLCSGYRLSAICGVREVVRPSPANLSHFATTVLCPRITVHIPLPLLTVVSSYVLGDACKHAPSNLCEQGVCESLPVVS